MILIAKDAFFEPKKFFYENLLQPSFTYDDTLLSCKNSEKINDPIFHKVQKKRFLAVFWPKLAQKFLFSKIGLCHISATTILHLCTKNHKIPMIQSREKLVTDERTNGRTDEHRLIYRTSR